MATVAQLLQSGSTLPGDSPRREAEILLGHCIGKPRTWLYTWPDEEVDAGHEQQYRALLARRTDGMPIAYLTGAREFWSLDLAVNDATLIPRPETETLVSWALELPLPDAAQVLDLGTGSGAIALAVAAERSDWRLCAVDSSEAALAVARNNALDSGLGRVRFLHSNWYSALHAERFDLILANPPYIDPSDPHLEQGDLRFEPRSALVAGKQGLADLVEIISGAPRYLQRGGWLLTEHGYEQGQQVRDLFLAAGFAQLSTRRDLGGQERITGGCLHADR